MFPRSVLPVFPHRRGREGGGGKKRHNNIVKHAPAQAANAAFESIPTVQCMKRASCLSSRHHSGNLKAKKELGCWCWHREKKNTQSHTICLRVCKQLQSCHGLTTTKSATAWQSDKRPDEAPRGGGRAPLCAHNTAVGDALLLYEEGEKNHVTPHGFFICWQDELRRRAGAAGAAGRRPAATAARPSRELPRRHFAGLARELTARLGYHATEEERESTVASVSR